MVIRKNIKDMSHGKSDLWVLHRLKRRVFLFPTVPLGCLSICLPVCYCIRGTLASAMLNNASHLAKSLLAPRQSLAADGGLWWRKQWDDFSPAVKWNPEIRHAEPQQCTADDLSHFVLLINIIFFVSLAPFGTLRRRKAHFWNKWESKKMFSSSLKSCCLCSW